MFEKDFKTHLKLLLKLLILRIVIGNVAQQELASYVLVKASSTLLLSTQRCSRVSRPNLCKIFYSKDYFKTLLK